MKEREDWLKKEVERKVLEWVIEEKLIVEDCEEFNEWLCCMCDYKEKKLREKIEWSDEWL